MDQFFDIEKELKKLNIDTKIGSKTIAVATDRGTGKSTSVLKMMLKRFEETGDKFVYCRTTAQEIDRFADNFNMMFENYKCNGKVIYKITENFVIDGENEKVEKTKEVVAVLCNVKSWESMKSNIENNEDMKFWAIFYDEYNGKPVYNQYFNFLQIVKTAQRLQNNFYIFLCGNKDSEDNVFLTNWGVRFKDEITEPFVLEIEKFNIIYLEYPSKWFKKATFEGDLAAALAKADTKTNRYFNEGGYFQKSVKNIIKYEVWIENTALPKYYLVFRRHMFEIGYFDDKILNTKCMYMRDVDELTKDLPILCFDRSDAINMKKGRVLDDFNIGNICRNIYNYSKKGLLFFSSFESYLITTQELYIVLKYKNII